MFRDMAAAGRRAKLRIGYGEAGLAGTRLYANQRMTENIRLYASLGYRVDSEVASPVGVRVNMSKPRA
jgi:hypothetical protein